MKKIGMVTVLCAVSLALSIAFMSCLTSKQPPVELRSYSENVRVSGTSATELFTKINLWTTSILKEQNAKIDSSNQSQGTINATHTFWTSYGTSTGAYYGLKMLIYTTISIEVKDDGYRITFSDPRLQAYRPDYPPTRIDPVSVDFIDETRSTWFDLARNLRSSISGTLLSN